MLSRIHCLMSGRRLVSVAAGLSQARFYDIVLMQYDCLQLLVRTKHENSAC